MSKHILDRERRRKSTRVVPYNGVTRRIAPEGSNPTVLALMRRSKGTRNASLRNDAFLRIDRGYTA
ncbi:hypothetical protein [Tropicimonas sp.]|uniref:hypothetical protein n=1 Tax=Tropicimonas sp. TaxID=2067044 RepID=UPI003A8BFF0E